MPPPVPEFFVTNAPSAVPVVAGGRDHSLLLVEAHFAEEGVTVCVGTGPAAVRTPPGRVFIDSPNGQHRLPAAGQDQDDVSAVEWSESDLLLRTTRQNATPMYTWSDGKNRLLLGTDLAALTAIVVRRSGNMDGIGTPDTPLSRATADRIRAARASIQAMPAARTVRFTKVEGGNLEQQVVSMTEWVSEPIEDESAADAGARQIEALSQCIAGAAHRRPITALVSGGVDSGIVAALARNAGILDGITTLGTVWGNERAEAEELGEHVGLPVQYVLLTEEDILQALPHAIRMLGVPDVETVAIAAPLVALYRRGDISVGTLLTGYGSDLLNSGLRVDAGTAVDVLSAVRSQLEQATVTGEFSGIAAAAHGYSVYHPFWDSRVIEAALNTTPVVMRHRGREKGHLREAASQLLPSEVAWRPKQAVHRGSGIDENLPRMVARWLGVIDVDLVRLYDLIGLELVAALIRSPEQDIDGSACLEAAATAYRTTA